MDFGDADLFPSRFNKRDIMAVPDALKPGNFHIFLHHTTYQAKHRPDQPPTHYYRCRGCKRANVKNPLVPFLPNLLVRAQKHGNNPNITHHPHCVSLPGDEIKIMKLQSEANLACRSRTKTPQQAYKDMKAGVAKVEQDPEKQEQLAAKIRPFKAVRSAFYRHYSMSTKEKGGTKINGTTDKADTKPKSPSSTSEGSPSATPTDEPDADKKDGVIADTEDAQTAEDSKENLQNGTTESDEKLSTGDTAEAAAASLDSETKPKVSGDDDAADVKKEEDTDKEDTKLEKTADSADGDVGSGSEDTTKTNGEVKKDVPAKYDTNAAVQSGPTVGLLGMEALGDDERHRLRHRELFLSRQIETLPATHIRGKCSVTLLNEMETPNSYLGRDDSFFYSLVYDPQQRTLLADKGEIRIGDKFQAVIPDFLATPAERKAWREGEILETVVFRPSYHVLTERQIDQFLIVARSVGTFARALDSSSAAKQPSLHMSAAAASRDVSLFHALSLLHHADYDIGKAMCFLVPPPDKNLYPLCADKTTGHRTSALGGPLLCRDQLEEWSAAEAVLFEEALEKYGKDFNDIRQDFLPWKALRDIVEYYYMWKTTDRYIHQKRFKAVEAESRLKQVYIPTYNKPNPAAMSPSNPPGQLIACGKTCEGCELEKSTQWYMWGPLQFHFRLCQECWSYWKKFGGLRRPHKMDTYDKMGRGANNADSIEQGSDQDQLRCSECKKQFETPEKLSTHRATAHPPMRCPMDACRREFRSRNLLQRHLAVEHGIGTVPPAPGQPGSNDLGSPLTPENQLMVSGRNGPKVPRQPFFLHTTFLTRVARRLAPKRLLSARRHARNPFLNINVQLIKNNCQTKSPVEIMRIAQSIANRSQNLSLQREQQQNQVQQQMINSAENAKLANAAEAKKRQQNGVADGAPPMKMMKSGTEESAY